MRKSGRGLDTHHVAGGFGFEVRSKRRQGKTCIAGIAFFCRHQESLALLECPQQRGWRKEEGEASKVLYSLCGRSARNLHMLRWISLPVSPRTTNRQAWGKLPAHTSRLVSSRHDVRTERGLSVTRTAVEGKELMTVAAPKVLH